MMAGIENTAPAAGADGQAGQSDLRHHSGDDGRAVCLQPGVPRIPMGELLLSLISGGRLRTGRSAGNYLHHPLSGRTGDGAQAGDYPQAADG